MISFHWTFDKNKKIKDNDLFCTLNIESLIYIIYWFMFYFY